MTTQTTVLRLLRLWPATDERYWLSLMRRAETTMRRYQPDVPVPAFVAFLAKRWTQAPETVGLWLALLDDETIVGHAIAWVDVSWSMPELNIPGVPYLNLHQLIADEPVVTLREAFFADLRAWGERINALYQEAGSLLRVTKLVFETERDDRAFDRLLRGRPSHTYHVKTVPLENL